MLNSSIREYGQWIASKVPTYENEMFRMRANIPPQEWWGGRWWEVLGCGGNFNGNISGVSRGSDSCSPVIKSSLANIWFNVSILQFKLLNIQIWLTAAVEISISTPLLSPIQFGILWEKFNFRSDKTFNWNFLNKITNLAVLFNKSFSIDWLIEKSIWICIP